MTVVDDVQSQFFQNQVDLEDQVRRPILLFTDLFHDGRDAVQLLDAGLDFHRIPGTQLAPPVRNSVRHVASSERGVSPSKSFTALNTAIVGSIAFVGGVPWNID